MTKKLSSLKDPSLVDKQSSSSSSEQNTDVSLRLEVTAVKSAKIDDRRLNNIRCDEKGDYIPRNEKDALRIESVAQVQALKKELRSWDDWASSKIMQVTKQIGQKRAEGKKLMAKTAEALKLLEENISTEENVNKSLVEKTLCLNVADKELNETSAAIIKLQSEQEVIKEEMEKERSRSLLEGKKLEEALVKEEEALKKSKSIGSERSELEEEVKVLRRQLGQKQKEVEKAKCLLTESEIRVPKEEREIAKVVNEADSIKNERERVEALRMAEYNITKEKSEEKLKMNETEKKRLEYEISALKLEAESKRIIAMQKLMNMESSKSLEVFKNMRDKKKKKYNRECVMCLNEEMSVAFVPCGHRVLCKACNVKHEEKMNECPSCRTPIQKRIHVRFANS